MNAFILTDNQRAVLTFLDAYGPADEATIRRYLMTTDRGCAQTVGSLRRRGYIKRARDGVSWERA